MQSTKTFPTAMIAATQVKWLVRPTILYHPILAMMIWLPTPRLSTNFGHRWRNRWPISIAYFTWHWTIGSTKHMKERKNGHTVASIMHWAKARSPFSKDVSHLKGLAKLPSVEFQLNWIELRMIIMSQFFDQQPEIQTALDNLRNCMDVCQREKRYSMTKLVWRPNYNSYTDGNTGWRE